MSRRLAWTAYGAVCALAAATFALYAANPAIEPPGAWGERWFSPTYALVFGACGALLVSRVPRNATGWLLLVVGATGAVQGAGQEYAVYGLLAQPGSLPAAAVGAWLVAWLWMPGTILPVLLLLQLFPTGAPISRRWRLCLSATVAALATVSFFASVAPGPLDEFRTVENPFGIAALAALDPAMREALFASMPATAALSAAAIVVRFRRSRGAERLQLKWLAAAGMFVLAALLGSTIARTSEVLEAGVFLSILFVPVAITVAITRYRLYEIDRIINRTLVYAALTGLLAATYVLVVVAVQVALRPLGASSDLAIAGSTLAVAALFRPARSRVQNAVDRRFSRSRYDAARTLQSFTAKVRDEIDLEALLVELRTSVDSALRPSAVTVWLPR